MTLYCEYYSVNSKYSNKYIRLEIIRLQHSESTALDQLQRISQQLKSEVNHDFHVRVQ